MLKQEFSENANFVSKFRVEAQAAAGLMHPNIVNVYDVGEENDVYFIVMELVEGITLKKYIERKARLSVKEAISIAIQVSMGIEAAHNNHIIHRDIKPQNIIISKERISVLQKQLPAIPLPPMLWVPYIILPPSRQGAATAMKKAISIRWALRCLKC